MKMASVKEMGGAGTARQLHHVCQAQMFPLQVNMRHIKEPCLTVAALVCSACESSLGC